MRRHAGCSHAIVAAILSVVAVAACRKETPSAPAGEAGAAGSVAAAESVAGGDERFDAGRAGGCEGAALALFAALLDPRCAASAREWNAALDASTGHLRQEATRDGEQILFALVNDGTSPVAVPLRYRPGRADLPAFSVLAEDGHRGVYELAAPTVEEVPGEAPGPTSEGDAGSLQRDAAPLERVHTARLTLDPHGAARARLRIDPRVTRRLAPPCPDASSACGETRLAPGHYVLHVGLLLAAAGIDTGEPARVGWDLPP